MSYIELSKALLGTREDFSTVCRQLGLNPEDIEVNLVPAVMCDNCSYWEQPKKAHREADDTVLCHACFDLEQMHFKD